MPIFSVDFFLPVVRAISLADARGHEHNCAKRGRLRAGDRGPGALGLMPEWYWYRSTQTVGQMSAVCWWLLAASGTAGKRVDGEESSEAGRRSPAGLGRCQGKGIVEKMWWILQLDTWRRQQQWRRRIQGALKCWSYPITPDDFDSLLTTSGLEQAEVVCIIQPAVPPLDMSANAHPATGAETGDWSGMRIAPWRATRLNDTPH